MRLFHQKFDVGHLNVMAYFRRKLATGRCVWDIASGASSSLLISLVLRLRILPSLSPTSFYLFIRWSILKHANDFAFKFYQLYLYDLGLGWRSATIRKVPGSIPGGVTGDFFRGIRQFPVPGVDSAS
jgi:hypothetical protein